ncbi:hypothetical protein BDA99DRAFT_499175 [Phascolomyces articulosus]|uniref:NAD(P)-binding protein n=1 Tax=Phascolomyces articulosus TaxID=60185 RepID=A0AAD5K792_9FUNG|nr:hypothetical protein BDA99DRAFT_499175 [Phascolomyces articulosus]
MFFSSKPFEFSDIPDLSGKVAIITGSNTGIGKVCAIEMARKNCQVIVASRSEDKGQAAVADIKEITGNDKVEFIKLNLLSLQSVQAFVEEFKSKYDSLHILLNNAGVMMCPYSLSEDGLETQFATNHVAHYFLTIQLLPLLIKSGPSRIVNVSSSGHNFTSFYAPDLERINDEKGYGPFTNYSYSKAFNILFTIELAKRLEAKGIKNVYVNSNHPGMVRSELGRHSVSKDSLFATFLYNVLTVPTEKGALTQMYLATSTEVESNNINGKYYVPNAKPGHPNGYSKSEKNAAILWDFTENLLKEKVSGYQGAPV